MYILTDKALGQETEVYSSPVVKQSWMGSTFPQAIIFKAITQGIHDENKLTNLVFFAKHPERGDQKLLPTEPQFNLLKQEWIGIRDQLVRPMLKSIEKKQSKQVTSTPTADNEPSSTAAFAKTLLLFQLSPFISASTKPSVSNALSIIKLICSYHDIPWQIGYVILHHEGGVGKFNHHDGVMQTIASARQSIIPRIPRLLKLALLNFSITDQKTLDQQLVQTLHREFSRRLAVQIAAGIQELKTALQRFNGYISLAYVAYNTGSGNASLVVTRGKNKSRPSSITNSQWEEMCLSAATLLHQDPRGVEVKQGNWLCDPNLCQPPGSDCNWIPRYGSRVFDVKSRRQLIGYQYLRSIRGAVPEQSPNSPCNFKVKDRKQPGSGKLIHKTTRNGALDELYDPRKLKKDYYSAIQNEWKSISDDGLPLKVLDDGRLVKVRSDGVYVAL